MNQDPDSNVLDTARKAYADASRHLLVRCGALFGDADAAADRLLEIAEEFGAGEAVARLVANAADFGVLEIGAGDHFDTGELEQSVEAVLDTQDALDTATAARNASRRKAEPAHLQTVQFSGREFVLDVARGEIRSVDDPSERYLAPELISSAVPQPDRQTGRLTEVLSRETETAPARPRRPTSPDRSR